MEQLHGNKDLVRDMVLSGVEADSSLEDPAPTESEEQHFQEELGRIKEAENATYADHNIPLG